MSQLYRCEVRTVLYVLADNPRQAKDIALQNAEDELSYADCFAESVSDIQDEGWYEESLVYHSGKKDISVKDALSISANDNSKTSLKA